MQNPKTVWGIYSPPGSLLTSKWEFLQAFVSYYTELYSPINPYGEDHLISLLDPLPIPNHPDMTRDLLDAPFKKEEIAAAIGFFPAKP